MTTISQVSNAMQKILQQRASMVEEESGFVQRSSAQLRGAVFAQTLVFGWMDHADASYGQLRHVAASLGVAVSKQAIEQRMGTGSTCLMRTFLQEAIAEVISSESHAPEVLCRFEGVYLQDGSIISLPAQLQGDWPGCGGSTPEAGRSSMQVQVRLEMSQGRLQGPWFQAGRESERSGEPYHSPLPQGCLYNVDTGYFTLADMKEHAEQGRFWLTQAKASTAVFDSRGQQWDLLSFLRAHPQDDLDVQVVLGKQKRLPVRLIAVRVSAQEAARRREQANGRVSVRHKGCQALGRGQRKPRAAHSRTRKGKKVSAARLRLADWTIVITNVPTERMSVAEALVLLRMRWQIELFWKPCKQIEKVDSWRSQKPQRVLTAIFAKWLSIVIGHWMLLIECWSAPNRSIVPAQQVMQWMAPVLALGVAGVLDLEAMVQTTSATMSQGCTVASRRQQPATWQYVTQPKLIRLC